MLDDDELTDDPCWPCDGLHHAKIRRLTSSVESNQSCCNSVLNTDINASEKNDFAVDFDTKRVAACVVYANS